ncbi:MAG: lamin tail domain-containing protein, partial [Planctomycetota bacterium]
GTLTFNPGGATTQTIEIAIVNDGNDEPDETIEITLSEPNYANLGTIAEHTYTIIDPRPFVAFDDMSSYGNENVSPVEIPVSLSWASSETVTVEYNATGGTAAGAGTDYTLAAGTLTFDPYEMTRYISVTLVDDDLYEAPDETIEITLSNPSDSKLGATFGHTFIIGPPTVRLCPEGDLDGDCDVDYNDVKLFGSQWLDPPSTCVGFDCADIDNFGGVNFYDFCLLADNWEKSAFPIVINEFMASNDETIADANGEFDDWFELYNAGPVSFDLGGMYLTDKLDNPTKWQIPPGVIINGGGFLVFWADEDEHQGPTHTNFKLSASGEGIGLFDTDGTTLLDSIIFEAQVSDISYGLYPDASDDERFFGFPTPGGNNMGAYLDQVADTKFSHDRGFYESAFNLSITCETPDVNIYYTIDGSEPNESVGLSYTGPITDINQTTVLRAAAYKPGHLPSNVDTQTYIFLDDVVQQPSLDSSLVIAYGTTVVKDALLDIPTISIVMEQNDFNNLQLQDSRYPDDGLPKEELPTSIELIYPDPNQGQGFQINCGIEGHSWPASDEDNNKRSFRLLFKSEFGPSQLDYTLFESAPIHADSAVEQFDRIILRAGKNQSWLYDRFPDLVTYVEDQWVRDSQIEMSDVGSHGTFVHLYVNGDYWGLFNPVERPDAWFASAYDGGDMEDYFAVNSNEDSPYYGHLSGDITRFNRLVALAQEKDLGDSNKWDEFRQLLDVEEFADYVVLFWFCGFGDGVENNWYGGMRNEPEGPFIYYMWDGEWMFLDTAGPSGMDHAWVPPYFFNDDLDEAIMIQIWKALFEVEDFRMLFSDRVYKHCFHAGALTDDNSRLRLAALSDFIYDPIIGESIRWGDGRTRDIEWLSAVALLDSKMDGNVDIFIDALRNWSNLNWPGAELYPDIDPPTFNQHGGQVATGFGLTLTNPNGTGTIYYTIDGTDPRQPITGNPVGTAGTATTLNESSYVMTRVFDDPNWSALNEVTFAVGPVEDNLRITEIMYHPLNTNDPNDPNTEYIELKNLGPESINLNLVRFTNGIDFTFPSVTLASGEHVLVVKDQNAFEAKYGTGRNVAGEYSGSLNNGGERIELEDPIGQTIHNFRYSDDWRENTDGVGYSLTIINPANSDPNSWDEKDSWRPSAYVNGSPGWDDTGILPNPGSIVINELLAHSDGYPNDWIELHNTTGGPIDIGGWFLSDNDSNLMKYKIQGPNIILAGDYIVFT